MYRCGQVLQTYRQLPETLGLWELPLWSSPLWLKPPVTLEPSSAAGPGSVAFSCPPPGHSHSSFKIQLRYLPLHHPCPFPPLAWARSFFRAPGIPVASCKHYASVSHVCVPFQTGRSSRAGIGPFSSSSPIPGTQWSLQTCRTNEWMSTLRALPSVLQYFLFLCIQLYFEFI